MRIGQRKTSVIKCFGLAATLLLLSLFGWWNAQHIRPVYAAGLDTDQELAGHPLDTGTTVEGGRTDMNASGFIFHYQIFGNKDNHEVAISGYEYNGQVEQDLILPATIKIDGETEPFTVVGVNGSVFSGCNYIKSVTFASTYKWIGAEAFKGCPIVSEGISFNDGMKEIRDRAFYGCPLLTKVTIKASTTSIGTGVFANCTMLNMIAVESGNQKYCAVNGVLYSKNMDMLIQWPAALTVGNSIDGTCYIGSATCPVRMICDKAFEGCKYLSTISGMYATVTTIGEQAFYGCTSLSKVKLPSTVTKIGNSAFAQCAPGLIIECDKGSVAENYAKNYGIRTSAICTVRFYDGGLLLKTEEVAVGGSATPPVLPERSGYTLTWSREYTNVQQNLDIYSSWKQNYTVTFKDAYSGQITEMKSYYGGSVTPPHWVRQGYILGWDTTAYTYVTKDLTVNAVWLVSMTDGVIEEERPQLGDTRTINNIIYKVTRTSKSDPRVQAVGCTKQTLTTLKIPSTVTFAGSNYKVTSIGVGAFRDMPKLTKVVIGAKMIKISKTAFYNCPKLKSITIKSKKLNSVGEKAFSKSYVKVRVNVPNSCLKKYKSYLLDGGLSSYAKVF